MPRTHARPRRPVSPRQARMLSLVGFRYSAGRDAYVLRIVGGRFGPVFQIAPPAPAAGPRRNEDEYATAGRHGGDRDE